MIAKENQGASDISDELNTAMNRYEEKKEKKVFLYIYRYIYMYILISCTRKNQLDRELTDQKLKLQRARQQFIKYERKNETKSKGERSSYYNLDLRKHINKKKEFLTAKIPSSRKNLY